MLLETGSSGPAEGRAWQIPEGWHPPTLLCMYAIRHLYVNGDIVDQAESLGNERERGEGKDFLNAPSKNGLTRKLHSDSCQTFFYPWSPLLLGNT